MSIESLRRMHQARPFQPFEIHLADGRALPVEHPENLAQSLSGRTIGVAHPDGSIEVVDLLLVVSLQPRPPSPPRRGRRSH